MKDFITFKTTHSLKDFTKAQVISYVVDSPQCPS